MTSGERRPRAGPRLDRLTDEERRTLYERIRAVGGDVASLQDLDRDALLRAAAIDGVDVPPGASRAELRLLLLRRRCARIGLGYARGVLEVLPDGYGFLRSASEDFLAGPDDVFVSASQVHRLGLRTGHRVEGPFRLPRHGESHLALLRVEAVQGAPFDELAQRPALEARLPVLPRRPLRLALAGATPCVRAIALLAPWARGQRVLLRAPPGAERPLLLADLAAAAAAADPDLAVSVCLIDGRPEDAAAVRRRLHGVAVVRAAAFDEPPQRRAALAELVLQTACRDVEAGARVLLVLDSLTGLVRAEQQVLPPAREPAAGLEPAALQRAHRFLAAARTVEGPGSLTVLATVRSSTGVAADEAIDAGLAGRTESEVTVDPGLVARGAAVPLDVRRTATRPEALDLPAEERRGLEQLAAELQAAPPVDAAERLRELVTSADDTAALLRSLARPRSH